MLVSNLENPAYLQLVLDGNLDKLPSKFAEASRQAGSFSAWQRRRCASLIGQIPRRLMRHDDFIDNLINACDDHCLTSQTAA